MSNWLISSIQQYTIDRLRVSFSIDYSVNEFSKLSCKLYDQNMIDVTDNLRSITDSNNWKYTTSSNVFDIVLKKNTSLTEGIYTFKLFEKDNLVYESDVILNYMEDIRTEFLSVELISLDTLLVKFSSIYEDEIYQSREMLSLMNFSCIDESGVSYSDVFESFQSIIGSIPSTEEPIKEVQIKLKSGRVLPKGYYTVRLTSRYKSRTFSILESDYHINFMTTTPPTITSSAITKRTDGEYVLTVAFGNYIEKSMLDSATRLILRSDGKNVSSYFNADRVSTTTISSAGVSYIVRLEIPLVSDFYVLQKGKYNLIYSFPYDYVDDISSEINTDWCLKTIPSIELTNLEYMTLRFPETVFYSRAINLKYQIEINGETISDPEILDAFSNIKIFRDGDHEENPDQVIYKFYIDIVNKRHLQNGMYSFIFYYEGEDEPYRYIAYIDFKQELTPNVINIYQSDIDSLTVELAKPLPIEVLEYCTMSLFDEYGNIDFSSRLESIHNSNIWEPGQITADRFNVMISGDSYLSSGRYNSNLIFGDVYSSKFAITLSYMEVRRGIIQSITQEDLSHVKISFSEPQSRKFLLTTELMVERKVDGADFTDRFELLENVIKADQYIISDLLFPMNHDASLPAGIYTFSFIWKTSDVDYVTVYSFDVKLGYMTSSPPEITTTTTFIGSDGLLNLRVNFGSYLEMDLFNQSKVSLVDSDDIDIISKMTSKSDWTLTTTIKNGIMSIKNISMKALDSSLKFEKDVYNIVFSWEDEIEYLENVEAFVDIDYILPLTTVSEVVSLDTTNRTARMYFEFDQTLQYSFFETLKVEVFDENGQNQTSIFDTIQHSNNIGPDTPESEKIPTNNINLNILNINELSFGTYTLIFYHEKDGIRTSEYKSMIDIMAAISPSIKNMEQVGIDTILVNLKASVPRMILETDTFTFVSFKKVNYTNYFKSIDESNDWDESIREVSSFYIKLKNGYKIGKGSYSFIMYAGSLRLDQCDMSIDYMEGADISIDKVDMVNLSTLDITFSEEQSVVLYKTLELQIVDENGTDVSGKFQSLSEIIKSIKTDYFESLQVKILDNESIPAGNYTINIIKPNNESEDTLLMSENVPLKYMSAIYPLLYEVNATKLDNGNDGVIMTFIPELELDLFANSGFTFSNISGMSVLDKFEPISNAVLDTVEKNGVTYIKYATLEFDPSKTLNKDKYVVGFNWIGEYDYMRNLSCEVSLDYILFPVKSVELVSSDSIEITFNKYLKNSYLSNTELVVKSIYTTTTETGTVITEVDFTDQFKLITESNNFANLPEDINKITLTLKDGIVLPEAKYRFIIAEKISSESGPILQYAYSGTLDIEILISDDILDTGATITQVSYDTLKVKFDTPQNIKFLNKCTFNIYKSDRDGNRIDLTSMFKSIRESNRYNILDEEGNIVGYDYYIDGMNRDTVIDEIHYNLKEANFIYLKLSNNCAIPGGDYTVYFINENKKYFESTVSTTFMTFNPPNIKDMNLKDGKLNIQFSPYAEVNSLCQSSFNMMTNRGFDTDGKIIGDDITDVFNPVIMSEMTKIDTDIGITYVTDLSTAILPDAMIASGKYRLTWNWGTNSFLPQIIYDGALNVYAKNIKSALTYNFNTIKVTLEDEYKWSFIKNLDINVVNNSNDDCSDLFRTIIDSNPELKDDDKVDSFFIMVEDGEEVVSDTYTFTLSYDTSGIEGDDIKTTAFLFMMSIVYLADEFPVITAIDNLSTKNYTIQLLTNANASSIIGKYIQAMSDDAKILMTRELINDYIGQYVKVFESASIDKLTIEFDREVDPCLLNALDHVLIDDNGNDVSSYFNSVKSSNTFKSRKVLDFVEITFKRNLTTNVMSNYEVQVTTADGRDISEAFATFWESNPDLNENGIYNSFRLVVDDDEIIEAHDAEKLKIVILDGEEDEPVRITGYSFNTAFRDNYKTNRFTMNLASRVTMAPGEYDLKLSYQNEPTLPDAVIINPFSYSGDLPFLSTNVGKIMSIDSTDLSHIMITFSEDLPTSIFSSINVHVYNEDRDDYGDRFEAISDTNDLTEGNSLSLLNIPYSIVLQLAEDNSITSGTYTFEFEIKISYNDEDSVINSDYYTLWTYTTNLGYMSNEKPNTITDVSMKSIDTLKISLEKPIDTSLLRNFKLSLENDSNGYVYDSETFKKLSESNNFGKYVLLTDNQYIMTSDDSSSWSRFDTGKGYSFNDIMYDKELGLNIVVCSNGKIITFSQFVKSSIIEYNTPTTKNLTSIIKAGSAYIVTGNDGIILRGTYTNNTFVWTKCVTNVSKTLTSVAKKSDNELVAVGYGGTVLYSNNNGLTWTIVNAVVASPSPNLTDVIYYDSYTTDDGSIMTPSNPGFYVTGTNGTLLYSMNGNNLYSKVSIGTLKSLYGIAEHGGNLIVVGDSGTIYRTTDTTNWYSIDSGASYSLKTITWCDTKFIICGSSGKWLTSISGEYWTQVSSVKSDTLKNAKFLDSQYDDNRKVDYFYLQLNKNNSIGAINFHTGTHVPQLDNSPAKYWISSSTKRTHVGDIFTQFATEGNTSIIVGEYQFTADKIYDGDDESTIFSWKECTYVDAHQRFSGEYTLYINLNDTANTLWNQKEKVNLTYLTSNPGTITEVKIVNPANSGNNDYVDPYIRVKMDAGDEEAIYYSSYEIKDKNGVDYTNRFMSLHVSDLSYSSSLKIDGVNIPRNPSTPYPPTGNYTFSWRWTPYEQLNIDFQIKNINNLIKSITRASEPSVLNINFTRNIPTEYFYKKDPRTDMNISKVNISMYKTIDGVVDTSYNYFSYFKAIETSTVFVGSSVTAISLQLNDGNIISPGTYSIMISNSEVSLDDDSNMNILSGSIVLTQELCTDLPTISMAKVMNYTRVVEPLVKGKVTKRYSGAVPPTENPEMMTLYQNWVYLDQAASVTDENYDDTQGELASHVGDIYVNTTTNESYTFILDKIYGYKWDLNVAKPCLCISFGDKPLTDTMVKYIKGLSILGSNGDNHTNYVDSNPDNWEYESKLFGDNRLVSKVAMAVNKTQMFYGDTNTSVSLYWKDGCIYETMQQGDINLPAVMASYGNIKDISAVNITNAGTGRVSTDLSISFTQPVFSSMLLNATFSLIYKNGNNGIIGEDYSEKFLSIRQCNSELLSSNSTVDCIYLSLIENGSIPSGIYEVNIFMEKPSSILDDDSQVVFTGTSNEIPWMTANPPSDISVSFIRKEPFRMPVLKIVFSEGMPAYTSCRKDIPNSRKGICFKIKVVYQETGEDFTSCFVNPNISQAISYNLNAEESDLVESIEIPMHETRGLRAGVYDIYFIFPDYALLSTIPINGIHRSITVKNDIISTCGHVKSFRATSNYKKLEVNVIFHDEINAPHKLINSQLCQALGIRSYGALMNKMSLVFLDENETVFTNSLKEELSVSGTKLTYSIKNNNRIDPGGYCAYYTFNGYESIDRHATTKFKGLIKNSSGKAQKDPVCYILYETHAGKTRTKIYSTHKALQARIDKMIDINIKHEAQLEKCKKCRANKFMTTSTISAQFDKYNFPENSVGKSLGYILKYYYGQYVSKKVAKCKNAKFIEIKESKSKESSYQCEYYQRSRQDYSWEVLIATRPKTEKFKKSTSKKSSVAYIEFIDVNGVKLGRVYAATKKGNESKRCLAYRKQLQKYIKAYNKKSATCQKCRKREIANKSGTNITWVSAKFAIKIKSNNKFLKKLSNAFKNKKVGCKRANFKYITSDANHCKVTCKNYTKKATFSTSSERVTFIK